MTIKIIKCTEKTEAKLSITKVCTNVLNHSVKHCKVLQLRYLYNFTMTILYPHFLQAIKRKCIVNVNAIKVSITHISDHRLKQI